MKAREVDSATLTYQPYDGCWDDELLERAGQEITLLPELGPQVFRYNMRSAKFPDGKVIEVFQDEIIINK